MSKYKVGRVHYRNSGMKGFKIPHIPYNVLHKCGERSNHSCISNSSFQPLVSEIDSSISAFGTSIATKKVTICVKNRMINSVNPDETAHDEPSHLDLHSLQKYLFWSTGLRHINLFNCLRHSGKIVDNLLAIKSQ